MVYGGAMENDSRNSGSAAPRASVTFPPDIYEALQAIAKSKKVSVAWVVREAAERYVADQWPLIPRQAERHRP